jgi:hypothetical protein
MSSSPTDGGRLLEAAAVGVLGGVLGAAAGRPFGLTVPAAVLAAANGVVSGWRAIYDWRTARGVVAATLDSTWSLPMTTAGLASHVLGMARGAPGFVATLSRRANRHVYQRGFVPRRGFAITVGNVISGAGDTSLARRRRLVADHEDVHVWQARVFGPLYPLLYGVWMLGGGVAGSCVWALRRRDAPFGQIVESTAYYCNPFEWWAYSRAGHWPPGGLVRGYGWRRPICAARQHPE